MVFVDLWQHWMATSPHLSEDQSMSMFHGSSSRFKTTGHPYGGPSKSVQILLSRTQAGRGKTVKQKQEETSQNHAIFP